MSNFYLLKVVGRGSETQLQAGENVNYLYLKYLKSVSQSNVNLLSCKQLHWIR